MKQLAATALVWLLVVLVGAAIANPPGTFQPLLLSGGGGVVTITAKTDSSNADAGWTDWVGANIGTQTSDRVVLFTIYYRAALTVTVTSCTIGGVTDTFIARGKATSGNTTNVEIRAANVPSGGGTATISCTFSSGIARYCRAVNIMTGTNGSVTPASTLQVDGGRSGSLSHAANSGQLGAFVEQLNSNTVSSWTNLTLDLAVVQAGGPMSCSNAYKNSTSSASETITANITSPSATDEGLAAASWSPP